MDAGWVANSQARLHTEQLGQGEVTVQAATQGVQKQRVWQGAVPATTPLPTVRVAVLIDGGVLACSG